MITGKGVYPYSKPGRSRLSLLTSKVFMAFDVNNDTAMDPKTIPPAVFQKRAGGNTYKAGKRMSTKLICFAFAYRLFHRDFSPINGACCIGAHSFSSFICILY